MTEALVVPAWPNSSHYAYGHSYHRELIREDTIGYPDLARQASEKEKDLVICFSSTTGYDIGESERHPRKEIMKTNDIKKGTEVLLRNGWRAIMWDNAKGNTRMCKVFGFETEIGSVYSHDIAEVLTAPGQWAAVEHTPAQLKLRKIAG